MNGIHRKAQKGFGMTDAIIASGLVGASIVSLSDLAGDYTKELRTANTRTEAIAHAEQKLENFRSLVDKQEFEEFVVDSETAETRNARSTELSRSWQVTHQTALYRQATVTVAWSDGEDDNKVMINTLLFAEDPFESGRKLTTLASATIGNLSTIGVDPEDNDLTDIDNNYGDGDDGDQDGPGDLDGDDVTSPPFSIALSGNVDKKKYFDYRKGVSVSGSYGGMCVTGNDKKSYSCTLGPIPSGEAWSGTLTIPVKSGKFLCTNTSLTKLAEDTELDIKIAKKSKDC